MGTVIRIPDDEPVDGPRRSKMASPVYYALGLVARAMCFVADAPNERSFDNAEAVRIKEFARLRKALDDYDAAVADLYSHEDDLEHEQPDDTGEEQ